MWINTIDTVWVWNNESLHVCVSTVWIQNSKSLPVLIYYIQFEYGRVIICLFLWVNTGYTIPSMRKRQPYASGRIAVSHLPGSLYLPWNSPGHCNPLLDKQWLEMKELVKKLCVEWRVFSWLRGSAARGVRGMCTAPASPVLMGNTGATINLCVCLIRANAMWPWLSVRRVR